MTPAAPIDPTPLAVAAGDRAPAAAPVPELSIVMPCLNEAETLGTCVRKAQGFLSRAGVAGEVIVADNGSTDGSREIAAELGARVVAVEARGYGSALRGGIAAARGRFVIMGDADDSYDFSALDALLQALRAGAELAMGNRFQGGIRAGAMPALHRYLGNPVLSGLGRLLFRAPVGDFHCGLRGFRREAYERLGLQTAGMEFASEMVIAATLHGLRIAEVPVTLDRDGRSRPPHLRSWSDGWRHLRFMLLYSPDWLFLLPGLALFAGGLLAGAWIAAEPLAVGGVVLDIHTLLLLGFLVILGFQLVVFAVSTKLFAVREGFLPADTRLARLGRGVTLERGLLVGLLAALAGAALLAWAVSGWSRVGFRELDPRVSMRQVIPAVVLMMLGMQTLFASFFLSLLGLRKR
jgi:glycosyltransferase involved in cell wall biosynthesis